MTHLHPFITALYHSLITQLLCVCVCEWVIKDTWVTFLNNLFVYSADQACLYTLVWDLPLRPSKPKLDRPKWLGSLDRTSASVCVCVTSSLCDTCATCAFSVFIYRLVMAVILKHYLSVFSCNVKTAESVSISIYSRCNIGLNSWPQNERSIIVGTCACMSAVKGL